MFLWVFFHTHFIYILNKRQVIGFYSGLIPFHYNSISIPHVSASLLHLTLLQQQLGKIIGVKKVLGCCAVIPFIAKY
jgi:hypothetical protein